MFNRLAALLLLLSIPSLAFAQSGSVSGKVTDPEGAVVPGANVLIVGTTLGSSTDENGEYMIDDVPVGDHTVEVRFLGFSTQTQYTTVVQGQSSSVNFQLSEDEMLLDAVVVTGTRSVGRSAMQSATPIDKIDVTALEKQGNGDMTETLKNIVPSFAATPLTGDGSAFVRPTSLRGLPPDDVLILMNSKRRHRSSLIAHFGAAMNVGAHAADIGMIPSIGLKSVEVLRDGAAAQYGSDAIAGVINFLLNDSDEGLTVQTQLGQWYEGETDYKVAANAGFPLTENGFLNVSGEYSFNSELSRGVQHAAAVGVPGAKDPAMNWGRPESSGFRSVFNAGIDLNETTKLYAFGNFADTYGAYSFFYRAPGKAGALEPVPTNPNDPSQGNFCWCDTFPAGFTPNLKGRQQDISFVGGVKGELSSGVAYDVSGSYGSNRMEYELNGSLNASWGPDSQTDFSPGDLKQEDLNFNADFSYPVQENLNLAGGLEYRKETYSMFEGDEQSWKAGPWAQVGQLVDPATGDNYGAPGINSNGFAGTNPAVAGEFSGSNYAAYLDAEFDVNEDLLLAAALRYEDFSEFGTTTNGKLAARYNLNSRFTLRGAYSTGFRAPTPGQANVTVITTSFDGVTGQQVQEGTVAPTHPLAVGLGGKALVPEDATNISFGLAARASQYLSLTVDAYQIDVDSRIIKSRSLAVSGDPSFSELAFYTNSLSTSTRGIDVVAVWNGSLNTDVSLALNYNETEVTGQEEVGGQLPVSASVIHNIENNLPKTRLSASVVHDFGKLSASVRANYYSGTIDERGTREEVDPAALIDLELSYKVNANLTLVGGANNILNTYPTKIDTRLSQGMPYPRRTPIGYHGGMTYLRAVWNM
ncbi:MAG: TonB-dependent receptor [Bacteroidetes Order II. Incertae sedis bacterium]|nr:TonB-dependent receptor [Bacteroidetes Order II. bacterium]